MKTTETKTARIVVRKQSKRTFGLYRGDELVEGGFFTREAAQMTADAYNKGEARPLCDD